MAHERSINTWAFSSHKHFLSHPLCFSELKAGHRESQRKLVHMKTNLGEDMVRAMIKAHLMRAMSRTSLSGNPNERRRTSVLKAVFGVEEGPKGSKDSVTTLREFSIEEEEGDEEEGEE